jgi:PilZ domain
MAEPWERRAVPRTRLPDRPEGRVRGLREVRLLDLSLAGAHIEHLDLVRLGARCTVELPPPFGALSLPAEVVWCTVIGRQRKPRDGSRLVAQSGLWFTRLTGAQPTALADSLEHLAAAPQPNLDSHRRSA